MFLLSSDFCLCCDYTWILINSAYAFRIGSSFFICDSNITTFSPVCAPRVLNNPELKVIRRAYSISDNKRIMVTIIETIFWIDYTTSVLFPTFCINFNTYRLLGDGFLKLISIIFEQLCPIGNSNSCLIKWFILTIPITRQESVIIFSNQVNRRLCNL